jgi:hypothetical protein
VKFIIRDSRPVAIPGTTFASKIIADSPPAIHEFLSSGRRNRAPFVPDKELLVVFCVNTRRAMKGWHIVALGSLNDCVAGIREVLRPSALLSFREHGYL